MVDLASIGADFSLLESGRIWDTPTPSFRRLVERLSTASARVRWEAHRDIGWSDDEMEVVPADPRWQAPTWDPLGATEWYRDQSHGKRAALGLYRTANLFKRVIEFEATLQQGLLIFASRLKNGHPAFRYVYHEITEEAQHTMMFQEFINRSGFDPQSSPRNEAWDIRRFSPLDEELPVLFFITVLAGEEAFDHCQRRLLASPADSLHPLMAALTRIHCAEEARHMSFARAILHEMLPHVSERDMRLFRYQVPVVVDWTLRSLNLLDDGGLSNAPTPVPESVRAAIREGPLTRDLRRNAAARTATVCRELGLIDNHVGHLWVTRGLL